MVAHSSGHPTFDHLWFRFSRGIDEVIDARVWEGIHFRNSDEQGMRAGRCVGQFVVRHALRSRRHGTESADGESESENELGCDAFSGSLMDDFSGDSVNDASGGSTLRPRRIN